MNTRWTRGILTMLAAALLLALPGAASAHPQLVGPWIALTNGGGPPTVYEFGPGEYVGNGMWRGPMRVTIGGCVTSYGDYYLRVYNAGEGTLALRDGMMLSTRVANVELREGVMEFMGVLYRR